MRVRSTQGKDEVEDEIRSTKERIRPGQKKKGIKKEKNKKDGVVKQDKRSDAQRCKGNKKEKVLSRRKGSLLYARMFPTYGRWRSSTRGKEDKMNRLAMAIESRLAVRDLEHAECLGSAVRHDRAPATPATPAHVVLYTTE